MEINSVRFGMAGGILAGILVFVLTCLAAWTGYAHEYVSAVASLFPGFTISTVGAFLGLIYGFLGGFFVCWTWAWIYDVLGEIHKG